MDPRGPRGPGSGRRRGAAGEDSRGPACVSSGHDPDLTRGPAGPPRRPEPADRRRPLVAERPREGPARLRRGHLPGRGVRRPRRRPRGTAGTGPSPLPSPAPSPRGWASSGSTTRARSSPTTTRAGRSRPGCGGCSMTSAIADVRLLDGGIQAWIAMGGELTADVPAPRPGHLTLRDAWSRTIERDALEARLGGVAVIDARAPERYRGEVEPVDGVAGHIPTARQPPQRRQPRPRRPVPRRGCAAGAVRPTRATTSCRIAAAA